MRRKGKEKRKQGEVRKRREEINEGKERARRMEKK